MGGWDSLVIMFYYFLYLFYFDMDFWRVFSNRFHNQYAIIAQFPLVFSSKTMRKPQWEDWINVTLFVGYQARSQGMGGWQVDHPLAFARMCPFLYIYTLLTLNFAHHLFSLPLFFVPLIFAQLFYFALRV